MGNLGPRHSVAGAKRRGCIALAGGQENKATMTDGSESYSANSTADLSRLKAEAEIRKLQLEAEEIFARTNRDRSWGHRIWQILIGGVAAGLAFYAWFIGFYSPLMDAQKERIAAEKNALQQTLTQSELQWQSERFFLKQTLDEQIKYNADVLAAHKNLATVISKIRERFYHQIDILEKQSPDPASHTSQLVRYFQHEHQVLDEALSYITDSTKLDERRSERLRDAIASLSRFDLQITIVFESDFNDLAEDIGSRLRESRYNVVRIVNWLDFREDGDGPMERFFENGPVIWFDEKDDWTKKGVAVLTQSLAGIFPESMTLRRGRTVQVPGITWYRPTHGNVEIWLFQRRD
jgi:hypothetical protein